MKGCKWTVFWRNEVGIIGRKGEDGIPKCVVIEGQVTVIPWILWQQVAYFLSLFCCWCEYNSMWTDFSEYPYVNINESVITIL